MTALPTDTTLARPRRRWPAGRPSLSELGIWLLAAAMAAGASALLGFGNVASASPMLASSPISFWVLLAAFAAAERFVAHIHFRRSAHSMSLAEIPLVFALLFAGGREVVIAGVVGRLIVLIVHRRLAPIRLAFNLGQFLLGSCLAVLVFHAIAPPGAAIGPVVWVAAGAATAANSVLAILAITAAVSLSEGRLGHAQVLTLLRTDLMVALANTSVGLCAATLLHDDWRAALLITIPIAGMFMTMRAYTAERQRHVRLEFLYETARALAGTAEISDALAQLLEHALDAYRAEAAEIVFFVPGGEEAVRTTVRADGSIDRLQSLDPAAAATLRAMVECQPAGAFGSAESGDPALVSYLESRGLSGGLFAVLRGERSTLGAIMIGDPSGTVDRFDAEDVRLFETLASNTSVALENRHLGNALWQMKKLQGELEHQAFHDPLTDLANRVLFAERVGQALDAETPDGEPARTAVIFIDVNEFKAVNDSLGHAAGDDLLRAIAGRLRDCVRPGDILARLGGDEFAILLSRTSADREEIEVARRITERLGERFAIAGRSLSVGASAGIAVGRPGEVTAEELIRNADLAMYRAKQSRSGYETFQSGMDLPVLHRHGLKQRLRDAAQDNSFDVHYQPIVELDTGSVIAHEALVRWLNGPGGCVEPAAFIPIAEEMGVIVQIGRQVLSRACEHAMRWPSERAVHVNLSPVELRDPSFLAGVEHALSISGLPPGRLVLEITEGVMLREPAKCISTLEQLRLLGVQLALDDFGTGYSSLSYVRRLPLDWLKIAQPFVTDIQPGETNQPFMRMILDLAASLDLNVVAEGIETHEQMHALRDIGCGFGQGFYLGRPTGVGVASLPQLSAA